MINIYSSLSLLKRLSVFIGPVALSLRFYILVYSTDAKMCITYFVTAEEDEQVACFQCGGGGKTSSVYNTTDECIDQINQGKDEVCGGDECYVSKVVTSNICVRNKLSAVVYSILS